MFRFLRLFRQAWPARRTAHRPRMHRPVLEQLEDRRLLSWTVLGDHFASFYQTEGVQLLNQPVAYVDFYRDGQLVTSLAAIQGSRATINWGDGTITSGSFIPTNSGAFAVVGDHAYAEANTWQIYVTVVAPDGTSLGGRSAWAGIADAFLTGIARRVDATTGQRFTAMVARFADANPLASAYDFTVSINWDDHSGWDTSATILPDPAGGFDVVASHAYARAGLYLITVSINDIGGQFTYAASVINVSDPPPPPPPPVDMQGEPDFYSSPPLEIPPLGPGSGSPHRHRPRHHPHHTPGRLPPFERLIDGSLWIELRHDPHHIPRRLPPFVRLIDGSLWIEWPN